MLNYFSGYTTNLGIFAKQCVISEFSYKIDRLSDRLFSVIKLFNFGRVAPFLTNKNPARRH